MDAASVRCFTERVTKHSDVWLSEHAQSQQIKLKNKRIIFHSVPCVCVCVCLHLVRAMLLYNDRSSRLLQPALFTRTLTVIHHRGRRRVRARVCLCVRVCDGAGREVGWRVAVDGRLGVGLVELLVVGRLIQEDLIILHHQHQLLPLLHHLVRAGDDLTFGHRGVWTQSSRHAWN